MQIAKQYFTYITIKAFAVFLMAAAFFLAPAIADAAPSVHEAVREYIETHMPWQQGTIRVEFTSSEPDLSTIGKDITFRIEAAGTADFIGYEAFIVRIYSSDGMLLRTETVRTIVEVLRDVIVAAKPISRNTVLTENDLHLAKKWVRRNMFNTVCKLDEAIGKRTLQHLRPDAEIPANMLKEVPLVRKGQVVTVLFDNGLMRISTVGIPEEDGTAGRMVRIKNITSNRTIYAKVLGNSLVAVGI